MDYNKIYYKIIEIAKNRNLTGYTEKHHIIPKCIGGNDNKDNLVLLTPEEHYVAHQLLAKIYPDNEKLLFAACMMIPNRPNNKLYGWLRRRLSKEVSKAQSGNGNSQFGTMWITNGVKSKKIIENQIIPDGWYKGRIILTTPKFNEIKNCNQCIKKEKAYKYYNTFLYGNYNSLREFAKSDECDISQPALTKMFNKYVDEYNPKERVRYTPIAQR